MAPECIYRMVTFADSSQVMPCPECVRSHESLNCSKVFLKSVREGVRSKVRALGPNSECRESARWIGAEG